MIDLGLDDREVAEMLNRALQVSDGPVEAYWNEFLEARNDSEDSELIRLFDAMPQGPVDITCARLRDSLVRVECLESFLF